MWKAIEHAYSIAINEVHGSTGLLAKPTTPLYTYAHPSRHTVQRAADCLLDTRPSRLLSRETMMTPNAEADDLESYFTNVDQLREMFAQALTAPTLARRLLIVHGVGGIGKTSLLRIFRLYCKRAGIPVALASGDEVKSASAI